MYFNKFLNKNNCILIVLLFLTCKSSYNLRKRSRTEATTENIRKTSEEVSKLSKNGLKKRSPVKIQAERSASHPKSKKPDSEKEKTKTRSLPKQTPNNLSSSYPCRDRRNLGLSPPNSENIPASDKIYITLDPFYNPSSQKAYILPAPQISFIPKLHQVLKDIRKYTLNKKYQDISIILNYNVLFSDANDTLAANNFFAILNNLLKMEKSILNANHYKTMKYKQLFLKKIEGIDISTSRSAIFSKVPVLNMLKKHVDIKKKNKGFTSRLYVSIFFALEYIESVIFRLTEKINLIILLFPDLKSGNIDFDIHMNINLMLYTGLSNIVKTGIMIFPDIPKKFLRYYFLFSEAVKWLVAKCVKGSVFENIFQNKDTLYLLDVMFYFDDSDVSDIDACFKSFKCKSIYDLKPRKKMEPIIENLSNKLIYKIIGYYFKIIEPENIEINTASSSFDLNDATYRILKEKFQNVSSDCKDTLLELFRSTYNFFHSQKNSSKKQDQHFYKEDS